MVFIFMQIGTSVVTDRALARLSVQFTLSDMMCGHCRVQVRWYSKQNSRSTKAFFFCFFFALCVFAGRCHLLLVVEVPPVLRLSCINLGV